MENIFEKGLSIHLKQGLLDLGFPREVIDTLNEDTARKIVDDQLTYTSYSETQKETFQTEAVYYGPETHKAAFKLNVDALEKLVTQPALLESVDENGNTMLHLIVEMAFKNYDKARKCIEFLKNKGVNVRAINEKTSKSPLEVAEERAKKTPEYEKIVEVLLG